MESKIISINKVGNGFICTINNEEPLVFTDIDALFDHLKEGYKEKRKYTKKGTGFKMDDLVEIA